MIPSYHAHVYFDASSRQDAAAVREGLFEQFPVQLGRWYNAAVGPHPQAMYQVGFKGDAFRSIVEWLMLNRRGLTILVHPETGDDLADHRDHCFWMGQKLPLDFSTLGG